jgi:hypothetical protein
MPRCTEEVDPTAQVEDDIMFAEEPTEERGVSEMAEAIASG